MLDGLHKSVTTAVSSPIKFDKAYISWVRSFGFCAQRVWQLGI